MKTRYDEDNERVREVLPKESGALRTAKSP
jgi:hypothetical protein